MFHGNAFEFFRNTALDARNYFSPERAEFKQNQPGGTIGGPLKKGKIFFFGDYQATRTTQGIETGIISVPSLAERAGNFSDVADQLTGTVNGSYWANLLSQRLGYAVSPGEPYYTPGCASAAQCVFPERADSPAGLVGAGAAAAAVHADAERGAEHAFRPARSRRPCATTKARSGSTATRRLGLLSGYYFLDDYRLDNPYPGQQGGANVPGFDALTIGRAQLWSFGSDKTFGQNTVNEFHVSLTHNANNVGTPNGGLGVTLASQGFVTGPGTPGIVVLAPQFEGVENLVFNTFTMGVTITGVNQTGDTLHLSDNVSKVVGCAHAEGRR